MSEELKAALARIACLEGEIAKRDETIARLEPQLNRAIQANYDLREELAACRVAVENCEVFRARVAELEARIVWLECEVQVNAAPVSEAKAQGVVLPERKTKADYGVYIDEFADEAAAIYNAALDEVARLNATHVQQVSVPDERIIPTSAELIQWAWEEEPEETRFQEGYNAAKRWVKMQIEAGIAAPAAPAADGWIPVSERLPAVESRLDQECRAGTLSIAPLNVSAAVLVFDGEKVRSKRLDWFDGCLPLPYCITHWMPLPAAPAANSAKGVV